MNKIYCFATGNTPFKFVRAISEEGHCIAMRTSVNTEWAKNHIGYTSKRCHNRYQSYYPNGYELVWVDDPDNNQEFSIAYDQYIELCRTGQYQQSYEDHMKEVKGEVE